MAATYQTIASSAFTEFREKASKFLGYAFPVEDEAAIVAHLQALKKEHPKANHHCYAWRLGFDLNLFRANDDGEPSGTAGKPILGQIDSKQLTNTLVVVVRYFGGTLLGTSGLIHAYRDSARLTLEECQILTQVISSQFNLTVDYALMNDLIDALKKCKVTILSQTYTDRQATLQVSVASDRLPEVWPEVFAKMLKVSIDEARLVQQIGGLQINSL